MYVHAHSTHLIGVLWLLCSRTVFGILALGGTWASAISKNHHDPPGQHFENLDFCENEPTALVTPLID
jgi:hypothetical protein